LNQRKARYHLRFQVVPGPDVEERAEALAQFCQQLDIEEVVLFVAGEEWNNGPLGDPELEEWYRTLRVCKEVLDSAGITVSLNPWYTVLHTDRGRHMPTDHAFTPMVSPTGQRAKAVASFACPNWQAYIAHLYGRLAEIGFRVIWVEDDFRYHNHAPLDWGGDFSEAMLGRFADKVGRDVTREEVVSAILRPGPPHPWRKLWLETWREVQLEVAQRLRDAVRDANADTILGLMSSHPSNHSIEGRDWGLLFQALSNDDRVLHRPNFAGYQDAARTELARSSFLLDYQKELRPESLEIEVTPEIENFPMTPFSKSDVVTWGHMALAQVHGADALMLDVFSFTCRCPDDEPWVGALLKRIKPSLDVLAQLFSPDMRSSGVGILWRPDASVHARTRNGREMSELYVPLTSAGDFLQSIGVAVQARPGAMNCLWGQVAWAYGDEELEKILAGGVWLDAEAVAILQQRGFGEYLPVTHHHWWHREEMNYSMERPEDSRTGLDNDVWLSVNWFKRVAYQTVRDRAEEWTSLRDARGKRIGCGLALGTNSLGGRVAACAWPLANEVDAYTLSFHRQRLVQSLVKACGESTEGLATTVGSAYTFPIDLRSGSARRVVVVNASLDPQSPLICVPEARRVSGSLLFTARDEPREVFVRTRAVDSALQVVLEESLPFCGLLALTVE